MNVFILLLLISALIYCMFEIKTGVTLFNPQQAFDIKLAAKTKKVEPAILHWNCLSESESKTYACSFCMAEAGSGRKIDQSGLALAYYQDISNRPDNSTLFYWRKNSTTTYTVSSISDLQYHHFSILADETDGRPEHYLL